LNFGLSPDFSVQLKVSLSESLSERLSQMLKWPVSKIFGPRPSRSMPPVTLKPKKTLTLSTSSTGMTHVHLGTVHWTSTWYIPQHCRTRVSPRGDENLCVLNNVSPSSYYYFTPKHHHLDFL